MKEATSTLAKWGAAQSHLNPSNKFRRHRSQTWIQHDAFMKVRREKWEWGLDLDKGLWLADWRCRNYVSDLDAFEAPWVFRNIVSKPVAFGGCHFLCSVVVMSYGDAQSWQQALFWLLEDGCLRLSTLGHLAVGKWEFRGKLSTDHWTLTPQGVVFCISCLERNVRMLFLLPRSFWPKEANVKDWTGKATSYAGLALLKHGGWGKHEALGSFSTIFLIPPGLKWKSEWTARISPFQTSFRSLSSNSSTVKKLRLRNIRSPCWTAWSPWSHITHPCLLPPFCDTDQRLPVWRPARDQREGVPLTNQPASSMVNALDEPLQAEQWWWNLCHLCLWFLWFSGGSKLPADCVSTMTCLTNYSRNSLVWLQSFLRTEKRYTVSMVCQIHFPQALEVLSEDNSSSPFPSTP